jgi:hypothetical protein
MEHTHLAKPPLAMMQLKQSNQQKSQTLEIEAWLNRLDRLASMSIAYNRS